MTCLQRTIEEQISTAATRSSDINTMAGIRLSSQMPVLAMATCIGDSTERLPVATLLARRRPFSGNQRWGSSPIQAANRNILVQLASPVKRRRHVTTRKGVGNP